MPKVVGVCLSCKRDEIWLCIFLAACSRVKWRVALCARVREHPHHVFVSPARRRYLYLLHAMSHFFIIGKRRALPAALRRAFDTILVHDRP